MDHQRRPKPSDPQNQLVELRQRVERLEGAAGPPASARAASGLATDLAIVEQLRALKGPPYEAGDVRGAVAYAGAATFGGREHLWIREHALPDVVDLDPVAMARALATLGHPARITLLKALLREPRSSQQLQEVMGFSSAGPLYHHLKELLAAGLVVQVRRSLYEIPAHHVVPLLVVLAAAADAVARQDKQPN